MFVWLGRQSTVSIRASSALIDDGGSVEGESPVVVPVSHQEMLGGPRRLYGAVEFQGVILLVIFRYYGELYACVILFRSSTNSVK